MKKYALVQFNRCCLTSVLLFTGAAFAADSPPAPSGAWAGQYQRAEWVSKVRIEGVGSLINPSLSRTQLVAVQAYRYTASVVRGWKGEHAGTITFQVDLNDCHELLDVDREYIVFGSSNHRGVLHSRSCKDLINFEDAGQLPMFLDEFLEAADPVVGQADS